MMLFINSLLIQFLKFYTPPSVIGGESSNEYPLLSFLMLRSVIRPWLDVIFAVVP